MKARTSRRRFLAGAAVSPLAPLPAGATEPHPDAALLAHEAGFMRLVAAQDAAITAAFAAEARAHDLARTRCPDGAGSDAWAGALHAAEAEIGYDAFDDATISAHRALDAVGDAVAAIRATTLDGLRAKARMQRHHEDLSLSIAEDLRALDAADGRGR